MKLVFVPHLYFITLFVVIFLSFILYKLYNTKDAENKIIKRIYSDRYHIFAVFVIGVIAFIINKNKNLKSNALKTLWITLVMLFFHYIFFPGLTVTSIGVINAISFVTRFAEIFTALGLSFFDEYLVLLEIGVVDSDKDGSFSLIAELLKNRFLYVISIFSLLIMIIYYKNLKKIQGSVIIYVTLFFVCVLTQFAINFIKAPIFQLFLGIALFPIFRSKILSLKKYNKRLSRKY